MGSVYGPNMVTDNLIMYLDAANVQSYPGTGLVWNDLVSSNYGNMSLGQLLVVLMVELLILMVRMIVSI